MTRYLVTGGNGFIGSHLITALDGDVSIASRNDGSFLDRHYCDRIVAGIDIVIHLAWSSVPATSSVSDVSENLGGSLTLLEACSAAKVKKFVFMSTGGTVYGIPESIPTAENHPVRPICSYGITKAAFENYLRIFGQRDGMAYAILRGANVYGPGQTCQKGQGVIAAWMERISENKPVPLVGDGSIVRDFLFIDDAVEAIVSAIGCKSTNLLVNIGSGCGSSLSELLTIFKEVTGTPFSVECVPNRFYDVPSNVLDISLAKEELKWEPKVTLREGIERTWKSWDQSKSEL